MVNRGDEMTGKRCHMHQNEECWEQICRLVWIHDTTADVIFDKVQMPHHVHLWYVAHGGDSPHFPVARFWPVEAHTLPTISLFLDQPFWCQECHQKTRESPWAMGHRDMSYFELWAINKSRVVILPESDYIEVSLKLHHAPWSHMKGDLQKRQIPEQTCRYCSKLRILLIQEIFWTVSGPLHRDGNQITDMMFTLMPFTMITNREYWAWQKEKINEKRRMPKLT